MLLVLEQSEYNVWNAYDEDSEVNVLARPCNAHLSLRIPVINGSGNSNSNKGTTTEGGRGLGPPPPKKKIGWTTPTFLMKSVITVT